MSAWRRNAFETEMSNEKGRGQDRLMGHLALICFRVVNVDLVRALESLYRPITVPVDVKLRVVADRLTLFPYGI